MLPRLHDITKSKAYTNFRIHLINVLLIKQSILDIQIKQKTKKTTNAKCQNDNFLKYITKLDHNKR